MAEERSPNILADWLQKNKTIKGRPTTQADAKKALKWKSDRVTKIKSGNLGKNRDKLKISFDNTRSQNAKRRNDKIKANRPDKEVAKDAGELWDELVGDKKSFTMEGRTFNSKKEYQDFEVKRHNRLTKTKEHANRKGGKTHGHAVPPQHKYAVESYFQSFSEDASPNYSSQDKVPSDFKRRLQIAGVPISKKEVAQRHVGTAERIGNPKPDKEIETILKGKANRKKYNGNGNGNGKSNGKNGKNGKINGSVLGAASKTRKVDALANIGANAATGNYAAVGVGGGALIMTQALQNRKTQQALGKQIGKLVGNRAGRTMMKGIPGLDVFLSGQESLDYLKQGKLDQAGIAALSGAIGWIPIVGDGISASLDLSNTGIDISRLQVPTGTSKKKGVKGTTRRVKFDI
jgi:hypothetical protein